MLKKPTDELNKLLEDVAPEELDAYLEKNRKYMADAERAFYYYMKDVIDEKRLKMNFVYSTAGLSQSYGEQIVHMTKHTKDRDVILRLCIAGRFSVEETNRALKLYKMSELYAKDPRDACLIVAINRRIYDLFKIDDILTEHGFDVLSAQEK
ncbi:MAG: hypothetical protein K6G07_02015 [Lachnospiraceae bacterium]|nr:hypothetical protein [Lachnospiraceae bacterium]